MDGMEPFDVQLPPRRPDSHKGDYGRVLIIGGSQGMAGAMGLAGMAALRSGAGLVRLAIPQGIQATVAGYEPCYTTIGLPQDDGGRIADSAIPILENAIQEATVVAFGPGLGRSADLIRLATWLYETVAQPLVIDADGLNALSALREILSTKGERLPTANGPRIFTPHPGEFARLLGIQKFDPTDRERLARDYAAQHRVVLLLKGSRTILTDGERSFQNSSGNPGMATGGTGDVLTGVIAALLGQGLPPLDAVRLGAYAHGLAGDFAAERLGQTGLIARDLVEYLPSVFLSLESKAPPIR